MEGNIESLMRERPIALVVEHVFDLLSKGGHIPSLMVGYDGKDVLEEAAKMVNRPETGFVGTFHVPNDDALRLYLRTHGIEDDYTHFLNRNDGEVTLYEGSLKNHREDIIIEEMLKQAFPKDFGRIGCKTEIAAFIPQAHPGIEFIAVRADGTTLLFDKYGLKESITDYNPETSTATYSYYRTDEGMSNNGEDGYIVPSFTATINKNGIDVNNADGKCVYQKCRLKLNHDSDQGTEGIQDQDQRDEGSLFGSKSRLSPGVEEQLDFILAHNA